MIRRILSYATRDQAKVYQSKLMLMQESSRLMQS